MEKEINWKNSEEYEIAITQWLIRYLRENEIRETHFSRDVGLGKGDKDARTFRKIKEGNRHWSIIDICKLAGYFKEKPSSVLAKVEEFYEKEGIVIPGKTVERIIELGITRHDPPQTLISTWRKNGKDFLFVDCDQEWKRVAARAIQRVVGMTSRQIFPFYPEVTMSFENAWKRRGEDKLTLEYKITTKIDRKLSQTKDHKRLLSINSKFVPPDFIVVYVDDISDKETGRDLQ